MLFENVMGVGGGVGSRLVKQELQIMAKGTLRWYCETIRYENRQPE